MSRFLSTRKSPLNTALRNTLFVYIGRAIDAQRRALKHVWRSAEEVATDRDLDPIRADPRFVSLLEEFRKAGPSARVDHDHPRQQLLKNS